MYSYNYFMNNMYRSKNNLYRNTNSTSLFSPTVGYDNGNLFANLYTPYKNYKPVTLTGANDKMKLLLDISRNCFAKTDLNFYLDNYPNDVSMIQLFNDYSNKEKKLTKEFESKYGPLSLSSDYLDKSPFVWENDAWPWEESFYV